jgi:prefoldin subunit 5
MSHASLTLAAVLLFAQGYVIYKLTQMEKIMATVPAGLAALQKDVADDTAAVQANTAIVQQVVTAYGAQASTIATLQAQIAGLNQEDAAVQALAATIDSLANTVSTNTEALQAAIAPPATPTA